MLHVRTSKRISQVLSVKLRHSHHNFAWLAFIRIICSAIVPVWHERCFRTFAAADSAGRYIKLFSLVQKPLPRSSGTRCCISPSIAENKILNFQPIARFITKRFSFHQTPTPPLPLAFAIRRVLPLPDLRNALSPVYRKTKIEASILVSSSVSCL